MKPDAQHWYHELAAIKKEAISLKKRVRWFENPHPNLKECIPIYNNGFFSEEEEREAIMMGELTKQM